VYIDEPEQWSEELRVRSNGEGPLSWIAGAFYFSDKLDTDSSYDLLRILRVPTEDNPTGFDPVNSIGLLRYPYTQETESWALFGQAEYQFLDAWTLTAGLRYTEDSIDLKYSSYFDESPYFTVPCWMWTNPRHSPTSPGASPSPTR
jgi:iron complex outermembrane receptor protein